MQIMKKWFLNNKLVTLGIIAGGIGGFMYWKMVGCSTGTCLITSHWPNSTAYGAMMGGLLFSIFKKERKDGTGK